MPSAQNLSDSGTVFFDDIDTTDTVSISFAPNNDITWVNPDGETIDPATAAALVAGFNTGVIDADAPGTTPWNYSVLGADLDFLAEGESITFGYTVTATDSEQATATTTVAFTITGTNDAPTVSADQATPTVSELVDASAQNLSDSGFVVFDDIDTTDTVSISFAPNNDITWVNPDGETIDPAAAAALGRSASTPALSMPTLLEPHPGTAPSWAPISTSSQKVKSITVSYTVTATDSEQATATTTVAFTITGTNDAPTVSADQATTVSELVDASAQNLSDSGTVFFDDIDTTDTVSISAAPNNDITWVNPDGETIDPATAAALVAGFNTGVIDADAPGTTPWDYSVLGADLDFLAEG